MRRFLPLICLLIPAIASATRPNVLILLTDDQRAGTLSAQGHPDAITPHLDTLVQRGLSMTSAYCMGANMGAVCRPSRNMILSGRSYFRWSDPVDGSVRLRNAPPRDDTLPAVFGAAGYETYHHGKRGNSAEEIHKQFDHSHYLNDFEARWNMWAGREIVDDAIGFLKGRPQAEANAPWLMYLAFATPHDPRAASPEALAAYDAATLTLPDNVLPHHPFDNGAVLVRDEWTALWPRTPERLRDQWHDYLATITTIDANIGRLMEHLRNTDQLDDTIIAFTSDHGLAMGSHGLMGKQNVYEDGYKAPMVLAGPGVEHGRSDEPIYLMDLYPTLAELSGIDRPSTLDGRSFAGLAANDSDGGPREAVSLSYTSVQRSVRAGHWKMIHYPKIGRTDFYDLASDPGEMHPLKRDQLDTATWQRLNASMFKAQGANADPLKLDLEASPQNADWVVPRFEPMEISIHPGSKSLEIHQEDDDIILAAAVGLDRHTGLFAGLRLDLQRNAKGRQSFVMTTSPEVRWMPLLDQLGRNHLITGLHGTGDADVQSLGFLVGERQRTPAWGRSTGKPFERRFGESHHQSILTNPRQP